MENRAYHSLENESQMLENEVPGKQATVQFVDNRPEAAAHKARQEAANQSPQVSQLRKVQHVANAGIGVTQLMKEGDDGPPAPTPKRKKAGRKGVGTSASRTEGDDYSVIDRVTDLIGEGDWFKIQGYIEILERSVINRANWDEKHGCGTHRFRTDLEKEQLDRLKNSKVGRMTLKQFKAFLKEQEKKAKREAKKNRLKTPEELKDEENARLDRLIEEQKAEDDEKKAKKEARRLAGIARRKETKAAKAAKEKEEKAAISKSDPKTPEEKPEAPVEETEVLLTEESESEPAETKRKDCSIL